MKHLEIKQIDDLWFLGGGPGWNDNSKVYEFTTP